MAAGNSRRPLRRSIARTLFAWRLFASPTWVCRSTFPSVQRLVVFCVPVRPSQSVRVRFLTTRENASLSLFDRSGVWSRPFLKRGWRVVRVDIQNPPGITVKGRETIIGANVLRWTPDFEYDGALAAPPCCKFCRPGSRWWSRMDANGETAEAIRLFRRALKLCKGAKDFWALENPPGRHKRLIPELGKESWQFHPWWFGDNYAKQTFIWGTAVCPATRDYVTYPAPTRTPNGKTQGTIARMSSGHKGRREETPKGFAEHFCKAQLNKK